MRILVYFRENRYGGVHTYLKSHVSYLINQGHEVFVTYAHEKTRKMFEKLGAKTICNQEVKRSLLRLDKDIMAIYTTYRFLKRNKIHCIFSHTSKGGTIGRIAGFLARTPKRIHVIHGFAFHEFSSRIQRVLLESVERFLSLFATRMISVNHSDRDTVIKRRLCALNKIETVVNGIKIPEKRHLFTPEEKDQFLINEGFGPKDRIILFVGRLMDQKNPLHLIKAFSKIPFENTHLVLVGEGPLKDRCKALSKQLSVDRNVHFKGFRKDVAKWYQIAHLFVLPSLWEGLPMTLIEAMSYGACCIASNIKGNRECISSLKDGILVPPRDEAALTKEMIRLLNRTADREKLMISARKRASLEFSEKRMLELTHQIITS